MRCYMNMIVVKCDKCGEIGLCSDTENLVDKVNNCNGNLIKVNITEEEFDILCDISEDNNFLQAMIDLKEKDIIEYNLKMSQFKSQLEQQKSSKTQNDNRPKCPTCGSTNIEKISATKKVVGGAMFGLFSSDIRNSMHCKNCGAKW